MHDGSFHPACINIQSLLDVAVVDAREWWESSRVEPHSRRKDALYKASERIRTRLLDVVRFVASSSDGETRPRLSSAYYWVEGVDQSNTSTISADVARALLGIEELYSRCLKELSINDATDANERTVCKFWIQASFLRQAHLIDALEQNDQINATDDLVEGLLEAGWSWPDANLHPPSRCSQGLGHRLRALQSLPSEATIDALAMTPAHMDVEGVASMLPKITAALDCAPPRLWRFVVAKADTAEPKNEYVGAVSAPERAAQFHHKLSTCLESELPDPTIRASLEAAMAALSKSLAYWLDRSKPNDVAGGAAERHYRRWSKHCRRAMLVEAQRWRRQWFDEQMQAATRLGVAAMEGRSAHPATILDVAVLCMAAVEHRCQPPPRAPASWYADVFHSISSRLDLELRDSLTTRLVRLQSGPALGAAPWQPSIRPAWLKGALPQSMRPARREQVKARLALLQESPSQMVRWLAVRAKQLQEGATPKSDMWQRGNIVDADTLIDTIFDQSQRAKSLQELSTAMRVEDELLYLEELDQAVVEFCDAPDPATRVTIAQLHLRLGNWTVAKTWARKASECDDRPKTKAISTELLAMIELRTNANDPKAVTTAYANLWEAYWAGKDNANATGAVLSPLMIAASLAFRVGLHGAAARCLRQIRKSGLDDTEEHTRRFRLMNLAAWLSVRQPSTQSDSRLAAVLADRIADLMTLHDTSNDPAELRHSRLSVAFLGGRLRAHRQIAELVAQTPDHRLEALGLALQTYGRTAIDAATKDEAIKRVSTAPGAMTLVCSWLVARYFDGDSFCADLENTLKSLDTGNLRNQLIAELRRSMSIEVAARCRAAVAGRRFEDTDSHAERLRKLMGGTLYARVSARGYANHGVLVIDKKLLQRALSSDAKAANTVKAPRQGVPVEVRSAISIVKTLRDYQKLVSKGLEPIVLSTNTAAELASTGALTLTSELIRKPDVFNGTWSQVGEVLERDLPKAFANSGQAERTCIAQCKIDVTPRRFNITSKLTLQPPATTIEGSTVAVQAYIDRLYGAHLARLADLNPDIPLRAIPILHTGRQHIEKYLSDHRLVHVAVQMIARDVSNAIWRPLSNIVRSNLAEVLKATAAEVGLSGSNFGNVPPLHVAAPLHDLRLLLATVFHNASKVCGPAGTPPIAVWTKNEDMIELHIDSIFSPHYQKGTGVGLESAKSLVEPWGGSVSYGRSKDRPAFWRTTIRLPRADVSAQPPEEGER